MVSAPESDPTPDDDQNVAAVEPADWVKPVELIELLQRRTEKAQAGQGADVVTLL